MEEVIKEFIGVDIQEQFYIRSLAAPTLPGGTTYKNGGPSPGSPDFTWGIPKPTEPTFDSKLGMAVEIDAEKYYGSSCCIKVIGVEAKMNDKRLGVQISEDCKKIYYTPNPLSGYWDCGERTDVFEYCVEDESGARASAQVILTGVVPNKDFRAANICIDIDSLSTSTIQVNLGELNKYEGLAAISFGTFNTKYINSVAVDQLDRSRLLVELNRECSAWNKVGTSTSFTYSIGSTDFIGETTFGTITIVKNEVYDFAVDVYYQVKDPLPLSVDIDLAPYYEGFGLPTDFNVVGFENLAEDRGLAILGFNPTIVTYQFNLESGFWNAGNESDVFKYTKMDPNGKQTSAYITIKKCDLQGSGSGSGSGNGSGSGQPIDYVTFQISVGKRLEVHYSSGTDGRVTVGIMPVEMLPPSGSGAGPTVNPDETVIFEELISVGQIVSEQMEDYSDSDQYVVTIKFEDVDGRDYCLSNMIMNLPEEGPFQTVNLPIGDCAGNSAPTNYPINSLSSIEYTNVVMVNPNEYEVTAVLGEVVVMHSPTNSYKVELYVTGKVIGTGGPVWLLTIEEGLMDGIMQIISGTVVFSDVNPQPTIGVSPVVIAGTSWINA